MSTYRVHLVHAVSTTVDVEAEHLDGAIDAADGADLPTPGNQVGAAYDAAGEWAVHSVCDETGHEVWSRDAQADEDAAEDAAYAALVARAVDSNRAALVELERLRAVEAAAVALADAVERLAVEGEAVTVEHALITTRRDERGAPVAVEVLAVPALVAEVERLHAVEAAAREVVRVVDIEVFLGARHVVMRALASAVNGAAP